MSNRGNLKGTASHKCLYSCNSGELCFCLFLPIMCLLSLFCPGCAAIVGMIFLIKNSNVAPPRGTCLRIEEEKGQRPAGLEPTISLNELVVLVLLIKPDS